ncbi:MAG: ferritin-like domain-containing protein [Acidobacteria bacterium]|nr:ferritin-like domain-containing protein [Acidobacteriota bacterium]
MFENEKDVLDWYERQPRALNKGFYDSVKWGEIRNHPLSPKFIPVILYMRDVESYTAVYYRELLRTPTGKDPVIRRFMERWGVEEAEHGDLLNRFLEEAGVETSDDWSARAEAAIPLRYTFENYVTSLVTNLFGERFTGTHMVWGAINELTTLQGYRRLWKLAGHPVLEQILRAVAREESVHVKFYWTVARLRLERSKFARGLARGVIKNFWTPVGQGTKPRREVNYLISTLFGGDEGVSCFDQHVGRKIERLPGFAGFDAITRRVGEVAL